MLSRSEAKINQVTAPDCVAQQYIVIGQIGAPHGIRGWVHVHSYTEPDANIANFKNWQLAMLPRNHAEHNDFSNSTKVVQNIAVSSVKAHNNHFVAKLAGIDDRDLAATLTNLHIRVPRGSLPKLDPNTYYWADLLGITVINHNGVTLGIIDDFLTTGANDVVIVKSAEQEYLIPYVTGEYILNVDLACQQMQVRWDPEL